MHRGKKSACQKIKIVLSVHNCLAFNENATKMSKLLVFVILSVFVAVTLQINADGKFASSFSKRSSKLIFFPQSLTKKESVFRVLDTLMVATSAGVRRIPPAKHKRSAL